MWSFKKPKLKLKKEIVKYQTIFTHVTMDVYFTARATPITQKVKIEGRMALKEYSSQVHLQLSKEQFFFDKVLNNSYPISQIRALSFTLDKEEVINDEYIIYRSLASNIPVSRGCPHRENDYSYSIEEVGQAIKDLTANSSI